MKFKALRIVLLATAQLVIGQLTFAQNKFAFNNTSLSFEKRVDDLVSRLTLEEKVSQMLNSSPAISRLGIPAYNWWNETLHGVARTPFKVTVYPQAIGMAATFDPASLFKMAGYSALEGRAIYNKAVETGRTNERYVINQDQTMKVALKALKGFQRVSLKPGESKILKFTLTADDLSYVNVNGERTPYLGKMNVSIGGSQPDEANPKSGNIIMNKFVIQ